MVVSKVRYTAPRRLTAPDAAGRGESPAESDGLGAGRFKLFEPCNMLTRIRSNISSTVT